MVVFVFTVVSVFAAISAVLGVEAAAAASAGLPTVEETMAVKDLCGFKVGTNDAEWLQSGVGPASICLFRGKGTGSKLGGGGVVGSWEGRKNSSACAEPVGTATCTAVTWLIGAGSSVRGAEADECVLPICSAQTRRSARADEWGHRDPTLERCICFRYGMREGGAGEKTQRRDECRKKVEAPVGSPTLGPPLKNYFDFRFRARIFPFSHGLWQVRRKSLDK